MGSAYFSFEMSALSFLLLIISPFLVSSSSLYGPGNCINNQVELPDAEDIHFVAIGDWGSGHTDQEEVAASIGEFCLLNRCDFVISTGDNFYHDGVESPIDEKFDTRWKDMYSHPSIAELNWYLTVGNHDHHYDHEWYQVEYSAFEPRWRMPCLTHSFNVSTSATSAMFVLVDTVSIRDDKNEAAAMKELFESELVAAQDNDWKIAIGHFPCHSGGGYAGIASTQDEIEPILNAQNVDFYLSGHDHNLQHWSTRGDPSAPDHIVTGAGGQNAYGKSDSHVAENEAKGMNLEYFTQHYGFTFFSVSKTEMTVSFVGADGTVIYQFTRYKGPRPPTSPKPPTSPQPPQECDESWWPDLDHDLVCADCKVLVHNMAENHPTCSSYCSQVGRVCTGAWEEDHDTCDVLSTETCEHDFASYTSDAICECRDPGQCNEHDWPDVDHGKVCGDCKVLVTHMNTIYSSCSNYCRSLGRECVGAWEEAQDTCEILTTEDCNHDFGSYTSDAICQCSGDLVI